MFVNEAENVSAAPLKPKRPAQAPGVGNEPISKRQASERLLAACFPRSVTIS